MLELDGETDNLNSEGCRGPGGQMSIADSAEGLAAVEGLGDGSRALDAARDVDTPKPEPHPATRIKAASTPAARFIDHVTSARGPGL